MVVDGCSLEIAMSEGDRVSFSKPICERSEKQASGGCASTTGSMRHRPALHRHLIARVDRLARLGLLVCLRFAELCLVCLSLSWGEQGMLGAP